MSATLEQLHAIIDDLRGTCKSLSEVCEAHGVDELTMADHETIDSELFLCVECEWWCAWDELSMHASDGDDVCDECAE